MKPTTEIKEDTAQISLGDSKLSIPLDLDPFCSAYNMLLWIRKNNPTEAQKDEIIDDLQRLIVSGEVR